ncbi:MAG: exlusion protein FxsA [Rhodospirillaceae bacterium]|nr:MAG: exlusion protein FxsA [Rhodospirillaceae bacterium]
MIVLFTFIAIPLIEIGLFIQVGEQIGLWPTIAVVVITAVIGTTLLRIQGLSALNRLQNSLNAGEAPLATVFDGFCLLAAGFLLLTPGFFTDGIGFLLFVPPFRTLLRKFLGRRIHLQQAQHGPHSPPTPRADDIIDGDWQDITPKDSDKSRPKDNNKLD